MLVSEDGDVENRIIALPDGLPLSSLAEASNYVNARIGGHTLAKRGPASRREIEQRRAQLDELTARVITDGLAIWSGERRRAEEPDRAAGARISSKMCKAMEDLERVGLLFEDLDTKKDLIQLLGLAERAEGVRIFIGSENKLFSLSGSALIVSPFEDTEQKIVGVLGVIGPDPTQLCPCYHAHGGLHGPPARPPCPLIFFISRSISPEVAAIRRSREPMSDEKTDPRPEDQPGRAHEDAQGTDPAAQASAELEALVAENADMRDRLLRTMAEMENVRRRTEREKSDTARYAISNFARDVLTVGDNLRRTIEHVPGDAAIQDPALKKLSRRRRAYRARASECARAPWRHPHRPARGSLRSELPPGHV